MVGKLDDAGAAIGKLAERVDALAGRRRKDGDSYLSERPVPEDKTLRRTDGSANGYAQQLIQSERAQDQSGLEKVVTALRAESLPVLTELMNTYARYPGKPKNKAEAIDRIERIWIRNVRFENKIR